MKWFEETKYIPVQVGVFGCSQDGSDWVRFVKTRHDVDGKENLHHEDRVGVYETHLCVFDKV